MNSCEKFYSEKKKVDVNEQCMIMSESQPAMPAGVSQSPSGEKINTPFS